MRTELYYLFSISGDKTDAISWTAYTSPFADTLWAAIGGFALCGSIALTLFFLKNKVIVVMSPS